MEFLEFAQRQWFLFAVAFALLGALIATELMRRFSGVKPLNPSQLTQLINQDDALLLDLRDGSEYRAGHIPSARHLPTSEIKTRLKEVVKFKSKPVVVYDAVGTQTSAAGKTLKREGFEQLYTLSGGIAAWRGANLPVSKAKKK